MDPLCRIVRGLKMTVLFTGSEDWACNSWAWGFVSSSFGFLFLDFVKVSRFRDRFRKGVQVPGVSRVGMEFEYGVSVLINEVVDVIP